MTFSIDTVLLSPDQIGHADRDAAASGIDSFGLMERAGQAVAAAALRHHPGASRFVVFCGPGNNGGDGYVAASALRECGCAVQVFHFGEPDRLRGDAAVARRRFASASEPLGSYRPDEDDVIIDALFGAGLDRDVPGAVASLIEMVNAAGLPVIAVDLPSGLCGRRGVPLGAAFRAEITVTFMARKPGHLLLPGRALCGETSVFDIGIPHRIIAAQKSRLDVNEPRNWQDRLPKPDSAAHKFTHGHLAVFSGGPMATGAARLSAHVGLVSGAGLVTVVSPPNAAMVNAGALTAVMLKSIADTAELIGWLEDRRVAAAVIGPGFGVGDKARQFVGALAAAGVPMVVDADAITSFENAPDALFRLFSEGDVRLVLTPHEGEFRRLFPDLAADTTLSKVERALAAAARANAIVLYKGADTVIADPAGRAVINDNAPPWLATAGSGDVLAGIIGGLLAQSVTPFAATAAGAYRHGEAGQKAGRGLTAETLITYLNGCIDN
jgi:ADP-dependent NAD(P)H-hydrate dehydratase / NAD(P)H-hydrate epimerase